MEYFDPTIPNDVPDAGRDNEMSSINDKRHLWTLKALGLDTKIVERVEKYHSRRKDVAKLGRNNLRLDDIKGGGGTPSRYGD